MKKIFVARTIRGAEYTCICKDAFYCNPKKAQYIADILNKDGYHVLRNDMYWKVFTDADDFSGLYILYKAVCRKNRISFYEIDY